ARAPALGRGDAGVEGEVPDERQLGQPRQVALRERPLVAAPALVRFLAWAAEEGDPPPTVHVDQVPRDVGDAALVVDTDRRQVTHPRADGARRDAEVRLEQLAHGVGVERGAPGAWRQDGGVE